MNKIILGIIALAFVMIPTSTVFANQPNTITLSITDLTNHSMTLNWSSATLKEKNHYVEILACGGVGCIPTGTLVSFTHATTYLFDGTAHEGLPSGSTWGFIVKECHRTGVLANQALCVSSDIGYGKTL
ncbi:MAG: hypothetical protein JHC41_08010 [Nitrosopumilus sp.]|jgi:hypothetical protein|nr:hypothetical protein [Nitrosopumilus sp.]